MRTLSTTLVLLLLCVGVAYGGYRVITASQDGPPKPASPAEEATLAGRPLSEFYLEHDRFLPATDPGAVPASEAEWLQPGDEVFGVVIEGHARAYPIPMISYNHVVNDVIEGIPIAVTY